MSATCPTCGSQISPLTLAVCLQSNVAARLGMVVRLAPKQAEILHTLLERTPRATSMPHLAAKVWGAGHGPDDERNSLRVMVSQLRAKLAPLSVRIESRHDAGYRLVLDELQVTRKVA